MLRETSTFLVLQNLDAAGSVDSSVVHAGRAQTLAQFLYDRNGHGRSEVLLALDTQLRLHDTLYDFARTLEIANEEVVELEWHIRALGAVTHIVLGAVCVLLCFIKPVLGNRCIRSPGFIVSEPRETHPRSEIADVPTSPYPPLDRKVFFFFGFASTQLAR